MIIRWPQAAIRRPTIRYPIWITSELILQSRKDNPYQAPASTNSAVNGDPLTDAEVVARASEIIGEAAINGIWLQTKPLPWFALYVGYGSVFELLLLALGAVFKFFTPGSRSETEELFGYSGAVFCVQTTNEINFIGSDFSGGTRQLTNVLYSQSSSTLIASDTDQRMTSISFRFESDQCVKLYFVGGSRELTNFSASIGANEGALANDANE